MAKEIKGFIHNAIVRKHSDGSNFVVQCSCGWRTVSATSKSCRRVWRDHPFRKRLDIWGSFTEK
jgi:hypothetical protein